MKFIFLESTGQELSKYIIFIYFEQVFQKLWQYKCNFTTFWHGHLSNMAMSHDSGRKFVIFIFKILLSIKFWEKSSNSVVLLHL